MKFIKRLLFILILLLAAFGVYRIVSPTAAKALLQDMKVFSNDRFGTDFGISAESEEILVDTGTILEETGTIIEDTGALQELSDEDELLLGDGLLEEDFGDIDSIVEEVTPSSTQTNATTTTTPPKTTTPSSSTSTTTSSSSSNNGLSAQDQRDLKALLENFTD